MEKQSSPNRSVERALEILECFLEKDEMILLEIAEKTGLSSSTALRILCALQEHDFVVKNPQTKSYHLGSKILWLSERVPAESYEDLKRIVYPHMVELNRKYNEDVRLFVPDGNCKLCIESVDSTRELRQVVKVGTRYDLVRGAAGKVILAYMSPREREKLVGDQGRPEAVLEQVRRDGYALSNGEREEGLFGLAVPVLNEDGTLVAAISLSGPTARFEDPNFEERKEAILRMGEAVSVDWQKR